jgi:predicted TIM-barrel fold metal-dependent hydrolase
MLPPDDRFPHGLTRRDFVRAAAVAAGLTVARTPAREPADPVRSVVQMPIIDTHQHLWDLTKFRLPWVTAGTVLARNFLLSDYHPAADGLGIVRTVYMEVDVAPEQQQAEADFVLATCQHADTHMAAGVVSGRPASENFRDYIGKFRGSPYVKGVRQVLHVPSTPAGYCLDAKFIRGVRLLGEFGLRFDLCMRPDDLPDAGKLIDACPDTSFILDHCGNAPVHLSDGGTPDRTRWRRDMEALAKRKNLVCKVSGLVNSAQKGRWGPGDLAPIVNHTLDVFGPDRVMFGGDWPVCTLVASLAEWVQALKAVVAARPKEQQQKLFYDNAKRVYVLNKADEK